ncbi:MAG: AAA family ATPase, partial [Clostridia bacterium]
RIEELTAELAENKTAAEEQSKVTASLREDINRRLQEKSGTNKRLEDIREEIKTLSDNVFVMQEEVVRLETRKAKLESEHENASNRLWDDYELTYNTALPFKKEIGSITAAQKQISELKGKIKALGNINVDSIEEYKEVKQRYEFMSGQVKDLEDGKKNLEKLIAEMLVVMQAQFSEKFKIINENFSKIFVDLFGGGHAGVRLSDPSDVLESGIEIEVQPPGKKLQSISLFSGGEHALTAIALLFALLKVSPSPFIVLDEIEAALDDENVYRFADYIKNYDDSTQFVIITHRRGTMEAANILYGVTMQEKGVSKLLSMNLEDIAGEEQYN